jgi:hypothetical protein
MAAGVSHKADFYFADATARVAAQGNVAGGQTAEDNDTGNRYRRTSAGWEPIGVGGAVYVQAQSIVALTGGQSAAVAISAVSAQSAAITMPSVVVTPTVDCFFRQGANPTALSNGTDQILLATNSYRISGIVSGNKLAFITASGSGTVYITPGA